MTERRVSKTTELRESFSERRPVNDGRPGLLRTTSGLHGAFSERHSNRKASEVQSERPLNHQRLNSGGLRIQVRLSPLIACICASADWRRLQTTADGGADKAGYPSRERLAELQRPRSLVRATTERSIYLQQLLVEQANEQIIAVEEEETIEEMFERRLELIHQAPIAQARRTALVPSWPPLDRRPWVCIDFSLACGQRTQLATLAPWVQRRQLIKHYQRDKELILRMGQEEAKQVISWRAREIPCPAAQTLTPFFCLCVHLAVPTSPPLLTRPVIPC